MYLERNLLGHGLLRSHVSSNFVGPIHIRPPPSGRVHVRVRTLVPLPQVPTQADTAPGETQKMK